MGADKGVGQRYDIIIEAKTYAEVEGLKSPNFWIKMRSCSSYCAGDICPPEKGGNCTFVECRQGILSYDPQSEKSPDYNSLGPQAPSGICRDPEPSTLKPIVRRDLWPEVPAFMKFDDPFEVDRRAGTQNCSEVFGRDCGIDRKTLEGELSGEEEEDELRTRDGKPPKDGYEGHPLPPPDLEDPEEPNKPHIWDFGSSKKDPQNPDGHYDSFMIDWANATLLLAADGIPADTWNPRFVPVVVTMVDKWRVFAIASNWTAQENHGVPAQAMIPGIAHPIHLHGHDFVVLKSGFEPFRYGGTYELDLVNPARRDVVMLPANGYVIIAFKANNPGTWLMHCHIAFHASAGLALEWVERPKEIPPLVNSVPGLRDRLEEQCESWRRHEASDCQWKPGFTPYQEDSGI